MSAYTKEIETFDFENIVEVMDYLEREELTIGTESDGDGQGTYEYTVEVFQTDPGYQVCVTTISNIWDDR